LIKLPTSRKHNKEVAQLLPDGHRKITNQPPAPASLLVPQASPIFSFLYINPLSSLFLHQLITFLSRQQTSGSLPSLRVSLLISLRNQDHNQFGNGRIRLSKMMSIFSPFDAFCAESNGWKLCNFSGRQFSSSSSSSSSSATQFDRKISSSSSAVNVDRDHENSLRREIANPVTKKDAENSNKIDDPSGQKPMTMTKKRNPRFAVEFDGLHCFETIIPY